MRSSHYEYLKEAAKSGQKSNFVTTANKTQKKKSQKQPGVKILNQNDSADIPVPRSPEKRKHSIKPNQDPALPNLQSTSTKKGVFQSNNLSETTHPRSLAQTPIHE